MDLPRDLQIHVLSPSDVGVMRAMVSFFGAAFQEPEVYCARQPDDRYLANLLENTAFIAVAAVIPGEVIGGAVAYVLPKFEQVRAEAYLYDLAVAEPWRRRGIATALIREVQRQARARGSYVVFVQADRGDEPAIALYSKLGTREEVLHFDLADPEPPKPHPAGENPV